MRIGLDVAQTCVERHGCGWLADRIANAVSETCAADQIILYHQFGDWINWDTSKGTVLERPNVFSPFAGSTWLSGKVAWTRIQQGRAELPGCPDIVHSHSFQAPCLGKTPLVYTVHDLSFWIHPEFTTETNRLSCQRGMLDAIRRAAGLVFVSENSLKDFLRLVPGIITRRNLPVAVVPQGSRFVPIAKSRTGFAGEYWLSVGALEPRKNVDLLLDAFELYWKRSKVRHPLHFVGGKGWKSEHTWRRIIKLQGAGLVVHHGYVDDNKLQLLYQEAFGMLFPSHYEGFGMPILESMSLATPVICSRRASLPEIGGDTVCYWDSASAATLAECMLRLEEDERWYALLSKSGLERARTFTWTRTASQLRIFYEQILA